MSEPDSERRARGRRVFAEINGFDAPEATPPITEFTLDHVFSEVWTRPGLTRKERRWIAITGVAAASAHTALDIHIRSALASGDITIEELREATVQFAVYQGFPKATMLHLAIERAWAELGPQSSPGA